MIIANTSIRNKRLRTDVYEATPNKKLPHDFKGLPWATRDTPTAKGMPTVPHNNLTYPSFRSALASFMT